MISYVERLEEIKVNPKKWLVTGCAGFIGSHLVEKLLVTGQIVVGIDNFATGYRHNLEAVKNIVGDNAFERFSFIEGDIANKDVADEGCHGVDIILHQGALGSVPRSISNPIDTNHANVTGFLQIANSAVNHKVERMIYASSSSVYGDNSDLPKIEEKVGNPLSPYAVTKKVNELYAKVFSSLHDIQIVGLRYFNVFGARQDPNGAYAAVIPKWIKALLSGDPCVIYGDGETSRDFCYIKNVVQANILAGMSSEGAGEVFNIACSDTTSLNSLYTLLVEGLIPCVDSSLCLRGKSPQYAPFRTGDIRHSNADITKAQTLFGYSPEYSCQQGIVEAAKWYAENIV